jgi:hypothetical protein
MLRPPPSGRRLLNMVRYSAQDAALAARVGRRKVTGHSGTIHLDVRPTRRCAVFSSAPILPQLRPRNQDAQPVTLGGTSSRRGRVRDMFVERAQAVSSLLIRGAAGFPDPPGRGRDGAKPGKRARKIVSECAVIRVGSSFGSCGTWEPHLRFGDLSSKWTCQRGSSVAGSETIRPRPAPSSGRSRR